MTRRLGVLLALVLVVVLSGRAARAAALPPDFPWNLEAPTIVSVELRLARGVVVPGVRSLVPLRLGQVLTRHALRRTVRLLYGTRRFRQVSAYVRPSGTGVAVSIVLFPRQRIADVSFLGATALGSEALRNISGLKRDGEFLKAGLEKASARLVAAYHRRGYHQVKVEPEVREGGNGLVAVVFRIDEGKRTRLLGVRFQGRTGLKASILEATLGLDRGAPLDLEVAEQALPRLRAKLRQAGYLRATVGDPTMLPAPSPGPGPWGYLVIPVSSGPVVRFRILGNTVLDDDRIRALLDLPNDEPATMDLIRDGAARIARRYWLLGYGHATVQVREKSPSPGVDRVDLVITEGRRLEVRRYRFPGDTVFPAGRLRRQICAAVAKVTAPPPLTLDPRAIADLGGHGRDAADAPDPPRVPDPCSVYEPDAWRSGLDAIQDLYRNDGYLGVTVEDPVLKPVDRQGGREAVIRVHEGVQTKVAKVRFQGARALSEERLAKAVAVATGHPLSYLKVEEGRYAIRDLYARHGYPFTKVHDRVFLDADRRHAEVDYQLTEGPEVHVGRIIVRGHHDTPASLVRSRLSIHQGDVWNLARVRQSQQAILALGIYRSAAIHFLDADDPAPVMDVVVAVSERKPVSVELGVGVSTEDGPRAYVEYTNLLFWGGSELHARAKANYPVFYTGLLTPGLEWETHLGLKFPRLLGSRTDLVWERRKRPTYNLTRLAWSVGTDGRLAPHVSGTIKAGIEFDDLAHVHLAESSHLVLTQQDREWLRLEEGQVLLASIEPGITIDLRNDPFAPTSGWLITGNLDWSKDLGIRVQPMHFIKATGAVTRYQPLPAKMVFAVSASGGVVIPLIPNNHTIGPKRFFLGGAETLRGFPVDSLVPQDQRTVLHQEVVACQAAMERQSLCAPDAYNVLVQGQRPTSAGGDAYVLFRGELRFPIVGQLRGGVFIDAGNLWREPQDIGKLVLRTAAGVGLRYQTPVGPVALDLGFNLNPDTAIREDPFALHFAIGLF